MSKPPLVIIGGGGHAATLCEILLSQRRDVLAVVSPEVSETFSLFPNIAHLQNDADILAYSNTGVELVNGIGAMPKSYLREKIHTQFKERGYTFAQVISSTAKVSSLVDLGEGVQILNNAVVCLGTSIGDSSIVNTSASIDHNCQIGKHCHIAPGVVMSGQVVVEDRVHIATGASLINNITVGTNSIIGVGTSVTKSIPIGSIAYAPSASLKS